MQKSEGRKIRYETKTPKEKQGPTTEEKQKEIRNYATVKEEKEERKRKEKRTSNGGAAEAQRKEIWRI